MSKLEPKVLLRNFPSVEQIQDSGSELRLESFAKVEDLKHNSELPLNANEQDSPAYDTIKLNCHAELVSASYSLGVEPRVGKTLK